MQLFIVILCVVVTAASDGPQSKLSCSKIQPVEDVSIPELRGGWVALESMSTTKRAGERSPICVHSEMLNTTTSGLAMLSELHRPGSDHIDIARNHFTAVAGHQGRWQVISNRLQLKGSEMLVISATPDSHLVLALCLPLDSGVSYLSNVNLLARRQERGSSANLTSEQLQDIRRDVSSKLGVTFEPLQYDTSC